MAQQTIQTVRERLGAQIYKLRNTVSQLRGDLKEAKQAGKSAEREASRLEKENAKLDKKLGASSPQSAAPRSTRQIAF